MSRVTTCRDASYVAAWTSLTPNGWCSNPSCVRVDAAMGAGARGPIRDDPAGFKAQAVRVSAAPLDSSMTLGRQVTAAVSPNLEFEFSTWPGRGLVRVTGTPYVVKSVRIGGVDGSDQGREFVQGAEVRDIEVRLTAGPPEVAGQIPAESCDLLEACAAVMFRQDPSKWQLAPVVSFGHVYARAAMARFASGILVIIFSVFWAHRAIATNHSFYLGAVCVGLGALAALLAFIARDVNEHYKPAQVTVAVGLLLMCPAHQSPYIAVLGLLAIVAAEISLLRTRSKVRVP